MNMLRCAVVIALSLFLLPIAAQDADRFESASAGFSLSKPAGWTFVSRGRVARSSPNADVSAEELQKAIDQQETVPLVAMIKDQAPFNPDFQVTLIPRNQNLAKASPKQILELLVLPAVQKGSPGLTLESPVRELKVSGHPAAEYVATDTVRTRAMAVPVRVRAILVARGKFFYLIDMVAPAAGGDQTSEEFAKILSSIAIEK